MFIFCLQYHASHHHQNTPLLYLSDVRLISDVRRQNILRTSDLSRTSDASGPLYKAGRGAGPFALIPCAPFPPSRRRQPWEQLEELLPSAALLEIEPISSADPLLLRPYSSRDPSQVAPLSFLALDMISPMSLLVRSSFGDFSSA